MKKRGLGILLAAAVDLNRMSVEEILAEAKKEGRVDSVGMPDTWANWGETWEELKTEYGLEHIDTDMSSAEEISLFESEKKKAAKDIGDVGQHPASLSGGQQQRVDLARSIVMEPKVLFLCTRDRPAALLETIIR